MSSDDRTTLPITLGRAKPRKAPDRAGRRVIRLERNPGVSALQFRHPDGRTLRVPAGRLDARPVTLIVHPDGGPPVAYVRRAFAGADTGMSPGPVYRVELDDWFVAAEDAPIPAPAAIPAEAPAPAEPGIKEEVDMLEANNFTTESDGASFAAAWSQPRWLRFAWHAVLAAAVLATLAILSRVGRGDEMRQWTHPYLVVPTCPGGRCPQPRPVAATYRPMASASSTAPGVGMIPTPQRIVAARPAITYRRTWCRFGPCR